MYKEYLSGDYTEVDTPTRLTVEDHKVTVTAYVASEDNCWLYKDFGASFFSDFTLRFHFNASVVDLSGSSQDRMGICTMMDTVDSMQENLGNNETQIGVLLQGDASNPKLMLWDSESGAMSRSSKITISLSTDYYIEVKRVSGTMYLNVYTDSGFNTLLGSVSHEGPTDALRYFFPVQAKDYIASTDDCTFYVEDIELNPYRDPKEILEALLDDIGIRKDVPTTAATVLVVTDASPQDLPDMFIKDNYDLVVNILDASAVRTSGVVDDKVTIYNWTFPITVVAIDKYSFGSLVCTGARVIEEARRKIRDVIRANPRSENYYIQIQQEPTRVRRVTGTPMYEIMMRVLFEQTQGIG